MGGNNATNMLIRTNHAIADSSRWGAFSLINSNMPYQEDNTALFYQIGVKQKIRTVIYVGSYKNPKNFGPLAGLQAFLKFKNGAISLNNQHLFGSDYTTNLIGIVELHPK